MFLLAKSKLLKNYYWLCNSKIQYNNVIFIFKKSYEKFRTVREKCSKLLNIYHDDIKRNKKEMVPQESKNTGDKNKYGLEMNICIPLNFSYMYITSNTVKPVLSKYSKIDKTEILMTNGNSMKVKSIAECSPWSILQYLWPALSDNWSWKPFLVILRVAIVDRFYCTHKQMYNK